MMNGYKVEKSLKVETTTKNIDLKGCLVFIDISDDTYSSYFEVLPLNTNLPYIVDKSKVLKMIESGGLLQDFESVPPKQLNSATKGLPITHDNLLNEGYVIKANMYVKNTTSVQLVKGHTWVVSRVNEKYNKDVKYIEDLL